MNEKTISLPEADVQSRPEMDGIADWRCAIPAVEIN